MDESWFLVNGQVSNPYNNTGMHIVIYGLTACTPSSAPDPTLGNEYRKPLPFFI